MYKLSELLDLKIDRIKEISKDINTADQNPQYKLDCSDVYSVKNDVWDAIFFHIRDEWKQSIQGQYLNLNKFMIHIEGPLYGELKQYLDNKNTSSSNSGSSSSSSSSSGLNPRIIYILLAIIFMAFGTLGFIKFKPYLSKYKFDDTEVKIGTLWELESVQALADYIEDNSVPRNIFDFLSGKKVYVRINGDKTLSYEEAQKRIKSKEWDIAFATSPMLSILAEEEGYSYVAGMFRGSTGYQAGLFVRNDSPIQSLDDVDTSTRVALGYDSASSFYMPIYDLYGKTITADTGHRGSEIKEMVLEGSADIGSASIGDTLINDPDLRIIHVSRIIPSASVYVSNDLTDSDQATIKQLMLDAPKEIQEKANYEARNKSSDYYAEFKKIVERVEEIEDCVDFSDNPVTLACPVNFQVLEGIINGASIQEDNAVLKISDNGIAYTISLPLELTKEIFGSIEPLGIQGKLIKVKSNNLDTNILITRSHQIEVLVD